MKNLAIVSAKPILKRLPNKRGAKSAFARKLNVEPAALTNWIQRGVSFKMLPAIAKALGITVEDYLREAGAAIDATTKPAGDPLLGQLTTLYAALDAQGRRELVRYANYLHATEHKEPSAANPFGKRRAKTPA